MKKCPKCGTMLDDSKKKCYMCGATLDQNQNISLGDVFNVDMGTTVSSSDTSFGFSAAFSKKKDDDFSEETGAPLNTDDNNGFSVPVVPVLTNNQEVEKPKKKMVKEPVQKKKPTPSKKEKVKKVKEPKKSREPAIEPAPVTNKTFFNNTIDEPPINNAPINWGNNMDNKPRKMKMPKNAPTFLTPSFMFNSVCFIVTICLLILGYNLYIKKGPEDLNGMVALGELRFKVDDSFNLENEDAVSRYYTRGGTCAVKISTGAAGDGFIDNYFEQRRKEYESTGEYNFENVKFKINGNEWSSLSVIELVKNNASDAGFSAITKYKYVSIVFNKKYYTIIYFNDNNDSTCASAYEKLLESLEFSKE